MRQAMLLAAVALLATGSAVGAGPQKGKPARKAPPKGGATPGVKGTTQMAGDNGKMGVTYTIGKGADAINFTLVSAEYSPSRIAVPGRMFKPAADEKCLVLHYTLHNPNPREFTANAFTLNFTAVDSKDINRAFGGSGSILSIKEGTNEPLSIALKPAQKVAVMSAALIPADASVPKLIVQRGNIQPVLRLYFKPGDIKPVPEPYGDPADTSGCTARAEVPAQQGTYYQAGFFDVKLVGTSYVDGKLGGRSPGNGQRYFVATLAARNGFTAPWTLNGATFETSVKTDDGEKTRPLRNMMLKTQRDESAGLSVAPGEEYTFRVCIPVPTDARATTLSVRESNGRTFVFPVGGAP